MATRKTVSKPKPTSPEVVGSVSAAELTELRLQSATIAEARRGHEVQRTLIAIAENGRRSLIVAVVRKYFPDPSGDEFSVNEDTGEILRFPKPE